jgi:hypothetical protein
LILFSDRTNLIQLISQTSSNGNQRIAPSSPSSSLKRDRGSLIYFELLHLNPIKVSVSMITPPQKDM